MTISQQPPVKPWTVLVYSAADNNLYADMVDDVAEMEEVGSDENANLLVQIDHGRSNGGAQRLKLEAHPGKLPGQHGPIQSPVEEQLGQVNMADARTLSKSIAWAMNKYPAEHYMLVVSDHGNSWKGCIQDDSSRGWMNVPNLKAALSMAQKETGKKLDVVGFDCCLMANTEVAYQLKDQANYMIASEMTEGGDGWPYQTILTKDVLKGIQDGLRERTNMEPRELAERIVHLSSANTAIHTLSAVDLGKMDAVKEAMVPLREAVAASDTPRQVFREIWTDTTRFFGYRDAGDYTQRLATDERITDARLKEAAEAARLALENAVIAEQHIGAHHGATGLTLQVHKSSDLSYKNLDFEKDVKWTLAQDRVGPIEDPKGPFE